MQTNRINSVVSTLKLLAILILAFVAFAPGVSNAQGSAGVRISPAVVEETLDPGQSKTYDAKIRNLNSSEIKFFIFTRNIEGVSDQGTPIFSTLSKENDYGLIDWVSLSQTEIVLGPNEEKTFNFTINVPDGASPGGHFGGVFVSVDAPDIQRSGAAIGYQVGNIISIRVSGDANESASIRQFSTDKFIHGSSDINFSLRVENAGNVLVRPSGPLEITNMLGKKVETVLFNESRGAVFPLSVREYKLNWVGNGTGFGRYEATVALGYGDAGAKKTMASTVSFWVLPLDIILPALGALAFLLLVTYIMVRVYIRRTLSQIGYSGNRSVRSRRRSGTPTGLLLIIVMLCVTALFMVALLVLFA